MSDSKKIQSIKGVIVKTHQETPDTWTLDIFINERDRNYQAGQFISISPHQFPELSDLIKYFEHLKGKKEPIRAYSIASAPHEKYLSITIKPESYHPAEEAFPPLLSPMLASDIFLGREIEFSGYSGAYVMPDQLDHIDHIVHLVAGSGIVPSFSIIKNELDKAKSLKHSLVFVNKKLEDIIFHNELNKLACRYPELFSVYYWLSQEHKDLGPAYRSGRPSINHIAQLIKNPSSSLVFACGPAVTKWQKKQALANNEIIKPRFMEWVQEVIEQIGIEKKNFKREIYG